MSCNSYCYIQRALLSPVSRKHTSAILYYLFTIDAFMFMWLLLYGTVAVVFWFYVAALKLCWCLSFGRYCSYAFAMTVRVLNLFMDDLYGFGVIDSFQVIATVDAVGAVAINFLVLLHKSIRLNLKIWHFVKTIVNSLVAGETPNFWIITVVTRSDSLFILNLVCAALIEGCV